MQLTQIAKQKSDSELQQLVLKELQWDPRVEETEVGVQVEDGVVTLSGFISSYGKKVAAEQAAHRVMGVLDVANDLEVRIPQDSKPTDTDIAKAVRDALRWNVYVRDCPITSTVSNGQVKLEGMVESWSKKDCAVRAIRDLNGVRGVDDEIKVRASKLEARRIRGVIEDALLRQADREARRIEVQVEDGVVSLSGVVRSWSERRAIERAAMYSPGVVRVDDRLIVDSHS